MDTISSLDQLVTHIKEKGIKKKISIALAEDPNTITAIAEAVNAGFVEAFLIGDKNKIIKTAQDKQIDSGIFHIIDIPDATEATAEAVRMAKHDETDIVMKGLVGTDKFLRAVLDKKNGLLPPKAVMSYVCAIEAPKYKKLLFVTDTAVIPFPDLNQKIAMLNYAVNMARKFGIKKPKAALIGASEKVSPAFPNSIDFAMMCQMAKRDQIKNCIVDGPLDIFLACDPESVKIKGIPTPINGEADILLFPTLEACNSFYKGLMLFGGGELGGLIQGTEKPVVVMSRSESSKSKFYCIALSCLMAE